MVGSTEQILGCLLGGALGDAMGAQYEGLPPSSRVALPERLQITDDTQLTLATCEAIIEGRTIDPERIAKHFTRWFRERRITGLGASTLKSLTELDAGGHWALVGATGERSAGNGAAMRIAPLAFLLNPFEREQRQPIRDVCRITHRHDEAYVGALAIACAVYHAQKNRRCDEALLQVLVETLPDSLLRDRVLFVSQKWPTIEEYAASFPSGGYIVDSVPLAILAAAQATDALATLQRIIEHAQDADTIAAMFGQIFGSAHGVSIWPLQWMDRIDDAPLLRQIAEEFAHFAIGGIRPD